jgi:DNA-binding NarL/FixJ family response regulator
MSVASSIRVLVAAPTASLTARIASDVRGAGFAVAGEGRRVDESTALQAVDVIVVAAGTTVAPHALPDAAPGIVIVGADPGIVDVLAHDDARAVGVVPADADARTIAAAIGAVAVGLSVRPPVPVTGDVLGEFPPKPPSRRGGTRDGSEHPIEAEPLTARESEVLDSLAQGLSNRAIAARLGISEHTVKFHLASIFGKLGVATRTGAVRRALRRGLIDL